MYGKFKIYILYDATKAIIHMFMYIHILSIYFTVLLMQYSMQISLFYPGYFFNTRLKRS